MLLSTHNLCFYAELEKIISKLSWNTPPEQVLCWQEGYGETTWMAKNTGQIRILVFLTLVLWTRIYPAFENSVDPDQLASEEANWSVSALYVIPYVNLYQQSRLSNDRLTIRNGHGILIYSTWQGLNNSMALDNFVLFCFSCFFLQAKSTDSFAPFSITRGPWWPCNAHLSNIALWEPDLELIKANILIKVQNDYNKVFCWFGPVTQFRTWPRTHQDKHFVQDLWWLLEKCDP